MESTSNRKQCLTYKDKTNFPVGTGSDIFYREFFQREDVEELIDSVFKNDSPIDDENFRKTLNNVISFAAIIRHTQLKPGKTDKKELVSKICEIAENLEHHLNILTNQYGYDTFKHIPILVKEGCAWKEIDSYEFLSSLKNDLMNLANIRDAAIKKIDADGGKKLEITQKMQFQIWYII